MNADIRSTDPGTNRDANTDGVVAHMVEGLVAFRDDTVDRADAGGQLDHLRRRQDLYVQAAPWRQVSQRRDDDLGRRRLVVQALARSGDAMALPDRAERQGFREDRSDRSARRQHGGHQARPADRSVPRHDGAAGLRSDRRHSPRLGRARRQVDCTGRHRPVQVRRMEARPVHRSHSLRRLFLAQRAARRLYRRQETGGRQAPHQLHSRQLRRQGRPAQRLARRHRQPVDPRPRRPEGAHRRAGQRHAGARPDRNSAFRPPIRCCRTCASAARSRSPSTPRRSST